jgi:hypothetical protein
MNIPLHFWVRNFILFIVTGIPSLVMSQWSTPTNISPNAIAAQLNESMGPCLGVSRDTVHVVWADRFGSKRGAIYYTQSPDTGLNWSTAIAITDTNGNAWNPAIAVNGRNIHVVWRTIDTSNNAHRTSWYKHSTDGGITWGQSIKIDTSIADWPAVAVSGNSVYVANDIVTSASPYNTEIFFLKSLDNGVTWSAHQQLTFAAGRSEDEAITAQGSDIYMSWNDNRNGPLQIFYKHSPDKGISWDSDVLINSEPSYGTMVSANGNFVDIPSTGATTGHYQVHLNSSSDTGTTWGADKNLTNDPTHTYYYPFMVRDSTDIHMTYVESGVGAQYLHSGDGGASWDTPYAMGFSNITPFISFTGCVVHVIVPDSGHINYFRNPTGNHGPHCVTTTGISPKYTNQVAVKVYPNPFISQTTIEILQQKDQESNVLKVYDIAGQQVLESTFGNTNKIILDRALLRSGIYFYEVIQQEKLISRGKLVIE